MVSLCYSANKGSDDAYDVSTSLTGYEPKFMVSSLPSVTSSMSWSDDGIMWEKEPEESLSSLKAMAHRGQADYCEPHADLDNLIAMESLCYSANKGSDDAYDVSTSLTGKSSTKLRSGWATLRSGWSFAVLVAVVIGTRKTHITCFDVLSQPRGYYDAFSIAQAGCSAERERESGSPRKALPEKNKAEVFCAIHDTTTLLNDDAVWLSLLQVLGVGASSQDTWQFQTFFPCVSVSISRWDGGWCGWAAAPGLLRWRAGGPRGAHNLCKTHAIILRIFL